MKPTSKKLINILVYLIIITITLEVTPYILSSSILGEPFSKSELLLELKKFNLTDKPSIESTYLGEHILHPYLGFVHAPADNYNDYCFPGIDPITKKNADHLNVVLMGGSVAKDLYTISGDRIKGQLENSENYKGRKINLIVFALGGFKQPQQLLALNYLMALGAEYDIVINLDGFNEVVLPFSDNLPNHVFPSYPRHWNIYARKKLDSKVVLLLGQQAVVKEDQKKCKIKLSQSIARYSNFRLFLWKIADNQNSNKIVEIDLEIRNAIKNSPSDYQSTGIYTSISDTTQFFKEQAEFWSRSSKQIADLSKAAEFDYFHFLQPNQYVNNSKKFTKEELQIAYEEGSYNYKEAAQIGYPFLIEEGSKLQNSNVNFIDLTMMFKNEPRTVYNDKCCHLNQLGYDLIADKITGTITSYN